MKNKRQLESILLVFVLVVTGMVVVFPLTAPKAKAYDHLESAMAEDGDPTYDADGAMNGVVVWHNPGGSGEDHIISANYIIEPGYTLNIPALDFKGDPDTQSVVYFDPTDISGFKMDVYGKLTTNAGGPFTRTAFMSKTGSWEGIYFHSGSQCRIAGSLFRGAVNGLVFEPGSSLSAIDFTFFDQMKGQGVQMDGVLGSPFLKDCSFDDSAYDMSTALDVANGDLMITGTTFISHGDNISQLHISNAEVYAYNVNFAGSNQPGNLVHIEGNSNGTVLRRCKLQIGVAGYHYIRADGCSPFIDNCSFETTHGERSVLANDKNGISAHLIVRNATGVLPGIENVPFDNSTMNATGGSSVTLQWYMDVHVRDPDGHAIENAPIWVKDRNGDAAQPPSQTTDETGWTRWFVVTELIQYSNRVDNFNPFNVSALNNSMIGYAFPEVTMNMSKVVFVTVPFNPIPNTPPIVSLISTPVGVQNGYITIDFMLEDPNQGDDGNLSIFVEYSIDGISWHRAIAGPGSDLDYLSNNTLYHFVWDSSNPQNLQNTYSTRVVIRITPYDRAVNGTPNQTGTFTVDNEPPILLSGPFVTATNTTAIINWTVHEPANASIWYGLDGSLTNQEIGSTSTTNQTVTLTGLLPGRKYSYVIYSIDPCGNEFSSTKHTFETEVHIHLYKGWNMISIPPFPRDPSLETVLAPIEGQYDAVQWYDPTDPADPWKHYKVGKPYGNDLEYMLPLWGYWIYMKNDAVFIPDQDDIPGAGDPPLAIELKQGWNLIGYPSVTPRNVTTALNGVPYDMVQTYVAATGQWLSYDPNTGSGDLTEMELGRGYWLHATANHNWTFSYV